MSGFDSALGWIGEVVNWFGQFIPRQVIVDSTQGAVAWVNPLWFPWRSPEQIRQRVIVHGPGRWWYWPFTTKWETWATARSTRDLPVQTVTTTDGHTFGVRALLAFEVDDIAALIAHTEDPNDAVRDLAGAAVHEVLGSLTREDVLHKSIDRKLKGAATVALKSYGVKVLELTLLECAPSRMYRVVQNPITDGI